MEPGILSQVALIFKDASLGWAVALAPFMEGVLLSFIKAGWFFFFLAYLAGGDPGALITGFARFLIGNGFALYMVRHGWEIVDSFFRGVVTLGQYLGSPPLDPSAIAGYAWVVGDPIFKSMAVTGFLDFATSLPTQIVGTLAEFALAGAFFALAGMLVFMLVSSYLLIAACPWFFAFWGFAVTRTITFAYIQLVWGAMNGLFAVMLEVAVLQEIGEILGQFFQNWMCGSGAGVCLPGRIMTWQDYLIPIAVGVVLLFVFIGLPIAWMYAMGGVLPSLASGLGLMRGGAGMVGAMGGVMGGGGSRTQTTGGGGGQQQVSAPQPSFGLGNRQQGQQQGSGERSPWGRTTP